MGLCHALWILHLSEFIVIWLPHSPPLLGYPDS